MTGTRTGSLAAARTTIAAAPAGGGGAWARRAWSTLLGATLLAAVLAIVPHGPLDARTPTSTASRATAGAIPRRGQAEHGLLHLPLAARGAVSTSLGAEQRVYRVSAVPGGFGVSSPAQHLRARFTRAGVSIGAGPAHLTLNLRAIGYGSILTPVGTARLSAHRNRVLYAYRDASGWYANGPAGIEQGFTLTHAPNAPNIDGKGGARENAGPLTVAIAVTGDLHASLANGAQGVVFGRHGTPVLSYDGLSATDADGHSLHSWLALSHRTLLLRIDAQHARFPLRIDPFLQSAELTPSGGEEGDRLGESVAISGNTIVVGAPKFLVGAHGSEEARGAAFVFTKSGSSWADATLSAELTAAGANEGFGEKFGQSVAITGETIAVGAPGADFEGGAAYIYVEPSSGWANATQTAKLEPSRSSGGGEVFGSSLAISGNTIAVGAPGNERRASFGEGAVYLFEKPASGWTNETQTAELKAPPDPVIGHTDDVNGTGLAESLAFSGTTIVAGAPGHNVGSNAEQGSVYVFSEPKSGWENTSSPTAELNLSSGGRQAGGLGASVALSSNTIVAEATGALYVFEEPQSGWADETQTAELSLPKSEAEFGDAVAFSGNTIVAALHPLVEGPEGLLPAQAYVYLEPVSGWANATPSSELSASEGDATDGNHAVAIAGNTIVVGAPEAKGNVFVYSEAEGSPSNLEPPTIGGKAVEGQTLKETHGTWTHEPTSFTYQWLRCSAGGSGCEAIAGASAQSYELQSGDVGHVIEVRETAENASGENSATSSATAIVPPQPPADMAAPTISGTPAQGVRLTEAHGTWTHEPTSFTYQWLRCTGEGKACAPIAGATEQTYVPLLGDVGKTLAVEETASNAGGAGKPASSAVTAIVEGLPANVQPPQIIGTPQEGQTLADRNGEWSNNPTSFEYQWLLCNGTGGDCMPIAGATEQTYVPLASQLGDTLTVEETASNAAGAGTPTRSTATAPVTLEPLQADAGENISTSTGAAVTLDASGSTPADDITEYEWEFGDGTSATGAIVNHVYSAPGEYTATVTVTAGGERESSASTTVTVTEAGNNRSTQVPNVTVIDAEGHPIAGAEVLYVEPSGARVSASTAANGVAALPGLPEGEVTVYAYASNHQPGTGTIANAHGDGHTTITLGSGEIATTSLHTQQLTPEQIEAAGINTSNPANQVVDQFSVTLVYKSTVLEEEKGDKSNSGKGTEQQVSLNCDVNGEGEFLAGCGGAASRGPMECSRGGCQSPEASVKAESVKGHPVLQWLILHGSATMLKQFYDVSMVVTNLSPAPFELTSGAATLNLPAGMSLAPTTTPQTLTQGVAPIAGSSSRQTEWVIRGDTPGNYNLSASYTGKLEPFEAPIELTAGVAKPLQVWGTNALSLSVQTDATIGGKGEETGENVERCKPTAEASCELPIDHVRLALTNHANVPVYDTELAANPNAHSGFIYQPDERFSDKFAKIQPGETVYSHTYVLIPALGLSAKFEPSQASVTFAGQQPLAGAAITTVPPPPMYSLSASPLEGSSGVVHLTWAETPGASGYELFATSSIQTPFGSQPIAVLPAGTSEYNVTASQDSVFAISSMIGENLKLESNVVEIGTGSGGKSKEQQEEKEEAPNAVAVTLSSPQITANGHATSTATAKVTDKNGKPLANQSVSFTSSDPGEQVGAMTNNGNGTYTATITASKTAGHATIAATAAGVSGQATLTQVAPTIALKLSSTSLAADPGSSAEVTAIATVTGANGPEPEEDVQISVSGGPAFVLGFTDGDGRGNYVATIETSLSAAVSMKVTAVDSSPLPSIEAGATLNIKPLPPKFIDDTPPVAGDIGAYYDYRYTASGFPAPTFALASGHLPPGLRLDPTTGRLTGRPTKAGRFKFAVKATNSVGSATSPTTPIAITVPVFTADHPSTKAIVGAGYRYVFKASGSPAPTFRVSKGHLPAGLTLDARTGVLSGTPRKPGNFAFRVEGRNRHGSAITPTIEISVR